MTATTTHQNVRLERGRHRSPEDGACVMELASMLAGEPFSDEPETACPVIASFLRAHNDAVTDEARQDLLGCAALVVGSRCPAAEPARIARCHELAVEIAATRSKWWRMLARLARWPAVSPGSAAPGPDVAERRRVCWLLAVLLRSEPDGRARAVAFVEELVAIGPPSVPAAEDREARRATAGV